MSNDCCIVVPFWNGHEHIESLLDSIPGEFEVIIVDDYSDESYSLPNKYKHRTIRVIRSEKRGYFSGAVNKGIQATRKNVLVLNQDSELQGSEWRGILSAPDSVAIAGDGVMEHPAWPNGYVQGTFMFLNRKAIEKVGLFNEEYFPLWGATAEWQLRACRMGFQAIPVKNPPGYKHFRHKGQAYGDSIREALSREMEKRNLFIRTPPLVSVIIPCYNHGRYLPDAVASLIGGKGIEKTFTPQSFQAFEIIIVDDASTDNSFEIASSLADPWKGIRVVRMSKNGGTAAANNAGIAVSFGKAITCMSADDMRDQHAIKNLYDVWEKNQHSIIYDDIQLKVNNKYEKWEMKNYDFPSLLEKNYIHAGIMFPKSGWKEIGGYPEIMRDGREDWAVNIAFGRMGYCGVHVHYPGYIYRREGQNRTLTNTTPEWREKFLAQLKSLFPDVYRGEFPMACCGGRSRPNQPKPGVKTGIVQLAGEAGMTLLEYLGGNFGNQTYYGEATGTRYVFSANKPIKNVDDRDVPYFLEMYGKNKKPEFRKYKPPVTPPVTPAVTVPEEKPVEVIAEVVPVEQVAEVQPAAIIERILPEEIQKDSVEVKEPLALVDAPKKTYKKRAKKVTEVTEDGVE